MSSQAPLSIFIVDDDQGALNSLRFLLESEGYDVAGFSSGAELLASLPRPDPFCIVIDVKMPNMDGMDLSRRLRTCNVRAPVILVTGHPDPNIRARALAAGLDLIEKPLSQDTLLSALAATGKADRNAEMRAH